jgi:hypothetical protein
MIVSKIDILFDLDWDPVFKKFIYLKDLINKQPPTKSLTTTFGETRYDFGDNGSFMFYNNISNIKNSSGALTGRIIENLLPWQEQLKNDFKEINLTGIGLQWGIDDLLCHVDGVDDPGQELSKAGGIHHCKLNYSLTDNDAITYAKNDDGSVETYPTVKNTAYLIDTTKPHWVKNSSTRFLFQLTFHEDFRKVNQWFSEHPGLSYGVPV